MANELYEIPVKKIDGAETNLGEFKDKVLLVVNVASKCGLTPQYAGLEKLYETYQNKGFEVLGFPANDFHGQEPGTEEEIKDFCSTNYDVQFPLFSKISVAGDDRHPLYRYLIEAKPETDIADEKFEEGLRNYGHTRKTPEELLWNFEKFLVNRSGEVVARFAPGVTAEDARLVEKVESELEK